jgi:flavin-binding protein dodecin
VRIGVERATQTLRIGVERATQTLRNVSGAGVKEQEVEMSRVSQ